jgi:putative Mn2+ efflux pump MntP
VFRFSSFFFQKKLEIVQFFPFGIVVGFFSVLNMVIGVVHGFFVPNSHQHLYKNPLELWLASFLFYIWLSVVHGFFSKFGSASIYT